MTGSDLTLKQGEALEQIAYLKKLTEQTRLRAADWYPYFLLWGVIWIIGNAAGPWVKDWKYGLLWLALCVAGMAISFIIGFSRRANSKKAPPLLKKLGLLSLTITAAAGLFFPFVIMALGEKIITLYWPFWIGVVYIANSVFIGRQLAWIGLWIVFEAVIALIIPMPYFYFWLSLAGGGSLLATGLIFKKQAKSHE